ncbi:Retrovirus-related Pol polyprotein from transposon TNT 1-94 [Gossypium australe]|uniref:Retrovirus-related Pol polyprotein from transposon TNT 1-94 n=1 Tax=Gossypium australe TaxID=47621 RepID=A0A5B6VC49_9ROSI|nr:Retrovirus-related Pol polyprotein from transposon TNT 1-94 [Gossypium australe]
MKCLVQLQSLQLYKSYLHLQPTGIGTCSKWISAAKLYLSLDTLITFLAWKLTIMKEFFSINKINFNMCAHEGKDLKDTTTCRQLVGSLIYLTLMRPEISYTISMMT